MLRAQIIVRYAKVEVIDFYWDQMKDKINRIRKNAKVKDSPCQALMEKIDKVPEKVRKEVILRYIM
jgi:hypothetical protein